MQLGYSTRREKQRNLRCSLSAWNWSVAKGIPCLLVEARAGYY